MGYINSIYRLFFIYPLNISFNEVEQTINCVKLFVPDVNMINT